MLRRSAVLIPLLLCVIFGVQCTHARTHPPRTTRPVSNTGTSIKPSRPSTSARAKPTTTKATAPAPPPPAPTGRPIWKPSPGSTLQIQLSTPVDTGIDAPVYEIDGEQNDASVVAALHAKGRKVICYIDAGAAESYRSDVDDLPVSVLGATVSGWPQERWLDVRQIQQLTPVMGKRMDMCKAKGFDAVDPDMLEAYAANSGFPITAQDQVRYNAWIARLAHDRGMSVAMKGNVDQVDQLAAHFDFAVNEECAAYNECGRYQPFLSAGKAVFQIEYDVPTAKFCPEAKRLGISAQRKRLSLDAWRETC